MNQESFLMKLGNLHDRIYMCKDDQNMLITQMGQVFNRWKEYFCTILNTEKEGLSENTAKTSGYSAGHRYSGPVF
jgi:hypothetical protein